MKSRYNPVLVAVILVGLVCALWVNWNRHTIEQRNNSVEMAMEYKDLRELAALEGLPEEVVLKKFSLPPLQVEKLLDEPELTEAVNKIKEEELKAEKKND